MKNKTYITLTAMSAVMNRKTVAREQRIQETSALSRPMIRLQLTSVLLILQQKLQKRLNYVPSGKKHIR